MLMTIIVTMLIDYLVHFIMILQENIPTAEDIFR